MNDKFKTVLTDIEKDILLIKERQMKDDEVTKNVLMFLSTKMDYLKYQYKDLPIKERRYQAEKYLDRTFGKYDPKKVGLKLTLNGFYEFKHVAFIAFILSNIVSIPLAILMLGDVDTLAGCSALTTLYVIISFVFTLFIIPFLISSYMPTYRIKPVNKWK